MAEENEDRKVRTRPRKRKMHKKTRDKIAARVCDFWNEDDNDRSEDMFRRLDRYAKVRGWTEDDDGFPWPGSSNIALPDISRAVEETQDSLVNAALATRPTVMAKAITSISREREQKVSRLLDHQFYEEQSGETTMHELAQTFCVDGNFVAYVPWVKETRQVLDNATFDPIPDDADTPKEHLQQIVTASFPGPKWRLFSRDTEGWSWKGVSKDGKEVRLIEFYTKNEIEDEGTNASEDIEMEVSYEATTFNGPKVIVKDYEDVVSPSRSSNLQIPGPSNPGGATHVILRDFPTMDEIVRLQKSGIYDLISAKKLEEMRGHAEDRDSGQDEVKRQKDVLSGELQRRSPEDFAHRKFTRYTCFDIYDFEDGKGPVDMVFTVLRNPCILLKSSRLTERYPVPDGDAPIRPLAESSYLPEKGRRQGRSLPEFMEGLHDFNKSLIDQIKDGGDMAMTPFFFYQPSSDMNPEITTVTPGEGYPMENPQQNLLFPNINTQGLSFGLNLYTLTSQLQDKLTVLGEIRSGRVPAGQSSALRTTGNLQALLAQGEARPERVLRRFFMGVTDIYRLMHRLNQVFLPKEKQFRILGVLEPGEDPYQSVSRDELAGSRFDFMFQPNVQNASLQAQQDSQQQLLALLLNPVSLQMGIVQPDGVYRLLRDTAKTFATDPDQYMTPPSPTSTRRKITAEAALSAILQNEIPSGIPIEGAEEHLQTIEKLLQMQQKDASGQIIVLREFMTATQTAVLNEYLKGIAEQLQAEQEAAQQQQAAAEFQRQQAQGPGGGGGQQGVAPEGGAPPVQGGELIDESLPGAGGGAVQ